MRSRTEWLRTQQGSHVPLGTRRSRHLASDASDSMLLRALDPAGLWNALPRTQRSEVDAHRQEQRMMGSTAALINP